MFFEEVTEVRTIINLEDLEKNPDIIYNHFMNYGDEVFYILKDNKIFGIVTPGDLYKAYCNKSKYPIINMNFSYIEGKEDWKGATSIFEKYPNVHEVTVVKDGNFLGIIKSGYRKTENE